MNEQQMLQREQQIRKLHRRIRQYRLTPQQQQILQRNKYELECMIQTKFSHSKSNSTYRFPNAETSHRLGVREQVDLHMQNYDDETRCKLTTLSYDLEAKAPMMSSFLQFSSQKEKLVRQSHSPQFRPFTQSLSHEKRLTQLKQPKRTPNTRMLTEADHKNRSQLEIEQEPSAMKIPVSKCTAKRKNEEEQSRRLLKRAPDVRLSAKESELRIKIKGKENEKKQMETTLSGNIKTMGSAKGNLSSQLKKIVLGKTPDEKKTPSNAAHKHKAGIFLVEKTLHKGTFPSTCKAKDLKHKLQTTSKFDEQPHYLRPHQKIHSEERLSKRSKNESRPINHSNSKSPNKPDYYARMFQSIKVKNNQSTASSTNQSSLTPMHASFKDSFGNSKSTCRMNLVSPLNKGYLFERRAMMSQNEDCSSHSLRMIRKG